jgi:hypothetical protein
MDFFFFKRKKEQTPFTKASSIGGEEPSGEACRDA